MKISIQYTVFVSKGQFWFAPRCDWNWIISFVEPDFVVYCIAVYPGFHMYFLLTIKATRGHNKNTALTPRWHKKLNSVIYTMELDSEVSMILCSFNFQGHRGVDAIFLNNKNKNLEPLHTIFCSRILGENEFWQKKLLQNGCGTVSLIGEH